MSDSHWAVTVSRAGEEIVTIESDFLSGRDITPEDEETIRRAAYCLLGFIGDGAQKVIAGLREAVAHARGEKTDE